MTSRQIFILDTPTRPEHIMVNPRGAGKPLVCSSVKMRHAKHTNANMGTTGLPLEQHDCCTFIAASPAVRRCMERSAATRLRFAYAVCLPGRRLETQSTASLEHLQQTLAWRSARMPQDLSSAIASMWFCALPSCIDMSCGRRWSEQKGSSKHEACCARSSSNDKRNNEADLQTNNESRAMKRSIHDGHRMVVLWPR